MIENVQKRNGRIEKFDETKVKKTIEKAMAGLDIPLSEVEMSLRYLQGDVLTKDIMRTLIKGVADKISAQNSDYSLFAGRLEMMNLRKEVYESFTPPSLLDIIEQNIERGVYDSEIKKMYTNEEIAEFGDYLSHDRDFTIKYAGTRQLISKYLQKNRVTGEIYETPQIAYMLIPMYLFGRWGNKRERNTLVKDFYDALSRQKISLPTPIMGGVRSKVRQFSSCVLIECDDSLDSINATASSIIKYVSQRAGIGVNVGRVRALGSSIRGGDAYHTGIIPFIKHFQTAVKSCSQGGIRGGAATLFYPLWHFEIEDLLVLKNNRGVEENRARHLDYAVQLNKLMYQRLLNNEDITLFSPSDVPGLYNAFFKNQEEFERLYKLYEADKNIRKKKVKATDIFSILAMERAQTGRIYIQNVDHCNTHSSFNPKVAPIRQSNLCMEITLPTKPLEHIYDKDGEIALCTLAAFNLGEIEDESEFERLSELLVFALDELIDYQDYPMPAAEISTKKRRSLGVGVTNFAYFLAKNGFKYSDGSGNKATHQVFEAIQYNLLKASNKLAQEKGACDYFNQTKYAQGILPIDTYKKNVDEVCNEPLHYDWEQLRKDIKVFGLRNSTVTALMPCETSSQVSGSTNGIEPPRSLTVVKSSKDGMLRMVVPGADKYQYECQWDMPDNKGYIDLVAIMQKFVDQSISANTNYDPQKFPDGKVPVKVILKDLLYAYKMGVKTLYYHNTRDGANEHQEDEGCAGGACKL